jgi:hypothetical protein
MPGTSEKSESFVATQPVPEVRLWAEQVAFRLRMLQTSKLGISPKETLDEEHLIKLITTLLEMVVTLDHLLWNAWRKVAPKLNVRREQGGDDRPCTIGRCLSGDREWPPLQITQMLEKTRNRPSET